MMKSRHIRAIVFASSLFAAGSAGAIEYFNLTQLKPNGDVDSSLSTTTPPINGAIFTTDPLQYPDGFGNIVGTGVIDPFLRIHRPNANCGNANAPCPEYGYNTTGDGSQPQSPEAFGTKEKEGHNWNHTLTRDSVGTVEKDGKLYRVFALDINEPNANGQKNRDDYLLSLDQFRIFVSDKSDLDVYSCGKDASNNALACDSSAVHGGGTSTYDPTKHSFLDGGANTMKIFDLDTGNAGCASTAPDGAGPVECDRTLGLNSEWTSGSGNGVDMVVYVPDELFTPDKPFIYLFSSFGEMGKNSNQNDPANNLPSGDFGQAGGFEEWYTLKAKAPVAPTLALFGLGFLFMNTIRKLKPAARYV